MTLPAGHLLDVVIHDWQEEAALLVKETLSLQAFASTYQVQLARDKQSMQLAVGQDVSKKTTISGNENQEKVIPYLD